MDKKTFKQKLTGGLADSKKPSDFDSKALAEGIKVEMEHTNDKKIAEEIAMDHLTEDEEYYKKLKTIEKAFQNMYGYILKGGQGSGVKGHHTELKRKKAFLESQLAQIQKQNLSGTHASLSTQEGNLKDALKVVNAKLQYLGKAISEELIDETIEDLEKAINPPKPKMQIQSTFHYDKKGGVAETQQKVPVKANPVSHTKTYTEHEAPKPETPKGPKAPEAPKPEEPKKPKGTIIVDHPSKP